MAISNETALALWYEALKVEIGIGVTTNNKDHLVNTLYAVRKASGDPELQKIIVMKPKNGEIWLCKKEVSLEDI